MSLMTPLRDTARGVRGYVRGVQWLRQHPRYMVLLVIPWVIGLAAVAGAVSFLLSYDGGLVRSLLFTVTPADAWWWQVLYQLSKVILYLGLLVLTLLGSLLLMNIVASPIYEAISTAVERDLIGPHATSLGLGGTLRVIMSEAVKVTFIFVVSTILLLIPGLNVIGTLIAAFLVGWDFYDYPLARRGWTFGRRFRFVLREFWAVLGFGLCLVIPGVQIILLPLAVAGGTILNVEALRERRLLGLSDERETR